MKSAALLLLPMFLPVHSLTPTAVIPFPPPKSTKPGKITKAATSLPPSGPFSRSISRSALLSVGFTEPRGGRSRPLEPQVYPFCPKSRAEIIGSRRGPLRDRRLERGQKSRAAEWARLPVSTSQCPPHYVRPSRQVGFSGFSGFGRVEFGRVGLDLTKMQLILIESGWVQDLLAKQRIRSGNKIKEVYPFTSCVLVVQTDTSWGGYSGHPFKLCRVGSPRVYVWGGGPYKSCA
ncbi:hypothetical protein H6P81_011022 [Aristolochia fimbriata]|uniref:Uncharacterized protein n=1 Tax=Aristolochia fimbriata TaxID=158543 RepID=A0AAV7EQD0_ARIFI|nr:hypothetical protein H6P81_011022 [Aristolochia fimbriata]